MSAIQLLLISAFLFLTLYYFVRLRNRIADVLLLVTLAAGAVLLILFPDWTNVLAQKLGVGRGADLLFYLCIVLFCFVIMKLYSRIRNLEQQLTDIIRKQSIDDAKKGSDLFNGK